MRLLITVLMMSAPLVQSAPGTRRAPGDESREDDLCSHPLDSSLCETSEHNSPGAWRKTGFELAAASALNDMRVISDNRFNEARTPSTITSTPRSTTTTTATRKPVPFVWTQTTTTRTLSTTNTLASQITSDTPRTTTPAIYIQFYSIANNLTLQISTPKLVGGPASLPIVIKIFASPKTNPTSTLISPLPVSSLQLPSVTNIFVSPTTSHTPRTTTPAYYTQSYGSPEFLRLPIPGFKSLPGPVHLPSVMETFASPPTSYTPTFTSPSPASSLQLPSVTNIFVSPTTSYTPRTTTPAYYTQSYGRPEFLRLPKPGFKTLSGLAHLPSVMETFASPPTRYTPSSSLKLPSVTNTLTSPTTSYTPRTTTPEFLITPKPGFKSLSGPAHLPSVMETFASPSTNHTPTLASPSPASSLQLPSVTNTFASPTTSYTPTPTTPSSSQPPRTRPATNRSPFHDACSTIFTAEDSRPMRPSYVLHCVLNMVNYYDQVHYHQIHNHNA